ncbi:1,2-phenylacetyl-CoA epoxidase subunit PaaC [Serratia entomophila]|uniref:1,2-phenylacetyl-CoA epoxidase subunit PaaC n=1 Tax=Serratia entomophila TaxID=42906 RepID=UPI002179F624|nr:1,2-phenylacetyl-CoA epoxidase subunit PaaC [Serratia entomophila]CAI0736699.1 Phenylacetic acid degradation protein paaC [Serratia entomophila]CAI0842226.1 Phenylacetic acid degradation protein paaC [Serratia entomophila]CAI1576518.1 Phenylacetic acid degradation protein paaC [Serratia entomophila]CAI1584074.1 Phenylacetic acid degradation protein paaC [Serratia entomophila]CAI1656941.1 Phenylacetic acid degradation protein paaC [Serratia entomophila]
MTLNDPRINYVLRQGDTPLILAQRLCAWCGHAPELEIDLALANIGLDLLGQARNFLGYAAELAGEEYSEDRFAFGRDERQFHNLLLAEQPNGGFNDTLVRQFLLDVYHVQLHQALSRSRDPQIAAIAAKSLKEADYHLRFSRGWMIRLGDGSALSHQKIQQALDNLWRFTAELFHADELELELAEQGIAADPRLLQAPWRAVVDDTLRLATLSLPEEQAFRRGGKQGRHSEHLGPLLAEMQFLQRAYPNSDW